MEAWKSPRKIEEEIKQYRRDRFEVYMQAVDRGELTRELAIAAFHEEDSVILWTRNGTEASD